MSEIDLLLEKFLTGYDIRKHYEEVFENPTKSEMRELMRASSDTVGVIMDRKNKKIYAFNRDRQIHGMVWRRIGDSRKLYQTDEILTAEWEIRENKWNYSSQGLFTDDIDILRSVIRADWSFFKKWIPTIELDVKEI
jgi:hypothetical protein